MQRSTSLPLSLSPLGVRAVAWLLCISVLPSGSIWAQTTSDSKPHTVLFDTWHSNTWIRQLPAPQQYNYHQLHSLARAARSLEAFGWNCEPQVEPWTPEALQDAALVVVNLVSADRPPFLISEIRALNNYLQAGGGVIVITDHTNCYFHNAILEPWFHELGIQLTLHSACDVSPHTLSEGPAWITIESFAKHPVTDQLRQIAFQTGGSVDPKLAIAWTSSQGWADDGQISPFGEGKSLGFFGDFAFSPGETPGPTGVIAAKEIGQGRLVIIGDQNAVGSMFLNYADNRRLWLQAALWASQLSETPSQPALLALGLAAEKERTMIWCYEPLSQHHYYWGSQEDDGLGHAFELLCKHADPRATDRFEEQAQWLILPTADLLNDAPIAAEIERFIQLGNKNVIVLGTTSQPNGVKDWVQRLPEQTLVDSPAAAQATWSTPHKSLIFWLESRSAWLNSAIPTATKLRSEKEETQDEALLGWMWEKGLQRVPSAYQHVPWDTP